MNEVDEGYQFVFGRINVFVGMNLMVNLISALVDVDKLCRVFCVEIKPNDHARCMLITFWTHPRCDVWTV